tara:strand:+ start:385 stop:501 length:117 start_codon:yes stop_codon:yes gene_type:complete
MEIMEKKGKALFVNTPLKGCDRAYWAANRRLLGEPRFE